MLNVQKVLITKKTGCLHDMKRNNITNYRQDKEHKEPRKTYSAILLNLAFILFKQRLYQLQNQIKIQNNYTNLPDFIC